MIIVVMKVSQTTGFGNLSLMLPINAYCHAIWGLSSKNTKNNSRFYNIVIF